jgi:hypothetical protein
MSFITKTKEGWKAAKFADRVGIVVLPLLAIGLAVYAMSAIEAARSTKVEVLLITVAAGVLVALVGWWLVKRGPLGVTATAASGLLLATVDTAIVFAKAGFFGEDVPAPRITLGSIPSSGGPQAELNQADLRTQLLLYVRSVEFDTLTHGQADRNILDSLGTRGIVAPAEGLQNTEREHLREGRVLWQVRVTNAERYANRGYPSLDLAPGMNWIVAYGFTPVENLPPDMAEFLANRHAHFGDPPGTRVVGVARSLIVSEGRTEVRPGRLIVVKQHLGYWWNRPLARFVGPGDHHLWANCDTHGCCEM